MRLFQHTLPWVTKPFVLTHFLQNLLISAPLLCVWSLQPSLWACFFTVNVIAQRAWETADVRFDTSCLPRRRVALDVWQGPQNRRINDLNASEEEPAVNSLRPAHPKTSPPHFHLTPPHPPRSHDVWPAPEVVGAAATVGPRARHAPGFACGSGRSAVAFPKKVR